MIIEPLSEKETTSIDAWGKVSPIVLYSSWAHHDASIMQTLRTMTTDIGKWHQYMGYPKHLNIENKVWVLSDILGMAPTYSREEDVHHFVWGIKANGIPVMLDQWPTQLFIQIDPILLPKKVIKVTVALHDFLIRDFI